ncbi:EFR1 family ferrodoxin [Candidatus Poribacteria bacterium]
MKILLMYFSATENTAKMAKVVKEGFMELGAEVDEYDITSHSDRQAEIDLKQYQAMVLGAPIHSRRAPKVVREWLRTLDGKGKKCSMFFTYGGFGAHPAHYSTRQILEEQGFAVVSSAEFLGKHTFNLGGWKALADRPDASDFHVAKEYVTKTHKRFTGEDTNTLGELEKTEHGEEQLDVFETFRFRVLTKLPTRDGEDCSMCMLCEESCPVGAMDAEAGQAEEGKCIACLRCVADCPDDALVINDMSDIWQLKLGKENATVESLNSKKSRIYL